MENIIEKYKDKLPKSYLDFVAKGERFYGYIDDEIGYIDIYELSFLEEIFFIMKEHFANVGKEYFPIGSNAGGFFIIMSLTSLKKELFLLDDMDVTNEHTMFLCEGFDKLHNAIQEYKLNHKNNDGNSLE